jgi:hypothetical protein
MSRGKKHTPEQIVSLLRQIEVAVAKGKMTPTAPRENGITKQTYRFARQSGLMSIPNFTRRSASRRMIANSREGCMARVAQSLGGGLLAA